MGYRGGQGIIREVSADGDGQGLGAPRPSLAARLGLLRSRASLAPWGRDSFAYAKPPEDFAQQII
jgi:hypothetical protein